MDSIKWKCRNWIVYLKKNWQFDSWTFSQLDSLQLTVRRVQLSSNFFLLLSLISHSCARFEDVFLKNIHQKRKYCREEKQDFERLLIIFNIKMSAKSKKIELNEEFCGERNRASGLSCPLSIETTMSKTKVWKKCQINFRFLQIDIFE